MIENLKNKIKDFSNFLIAYSGGLDSTVLLHQLIYIRNNYNLNFNLRAIHINHRINDFSELWAQHCLKQCNEWKISLTTKIVNIKNNKIGIEASAREARYNAFCKILKEKEVLLTAHHINDQCETFFLALKRGSGLLGLSSMPEIRNICNNKILLRPFLNNSHQQIKNWGEKYKLNWINDQSNMNIKFDRNFLRNKVLPTIYNRWPYFCKSVYRSALICREQEKLLNSLLLKTLNKLIEKDGSLKIDFFKNINDIYRRALLRRWIILTINIIPSYKVIALIWKELINSRKDASPKINLGKYEIRRYKNKIYLIPVLPSLKNLVITWNKPWKELILPQKIGILKIFNKRIKNQIIRKPNVDEEVTIRFCYNSCKEKNIKKKIKKIWQIFSVPVWQRSRIPMIFYNEKLISIIGMMITKNGYCKEKYGWNITLNK